MGSHSFVSIFSLFELEPYYLSSAAAGAVDLSNPHSLPVSQLTAIHSGIHTHLHVSTTPTHFVKPPSVTNNYTLAKLQNATCTQKSFKLLSRMVCLFSNFNAQCFPCSPASLHKKSVLARKQNKQENCCCMVISPQIHA